MVLQCVTKQGKLVFNKLLAFYQLTGQKKKRLNLLHADESNCEPKRNSYHKVTREMRLGFRSYQAQFGANNKAKSQRK